MMFGVRFKSVMAELPQPARESDRGRPDELGVAEPEVAGLGEASFGLVAPVLPDAPGGVLGTGAPLTEPAVPGAIAVPPGPTRSVGMPGPDGPGAIAVPPGPT